MKKRLLAVLWALIMVLALTVMPAQADVATDPAITLWFKNEATPWQNDEVKFNPNTQVEPLSGKGWSYVPGTRTLTLDNISAEYLGIYTAGKIMLELKGSNRILDVRFLTGGNGVGVDSTTIVGDGSLTITKRFLIGQPNVLMTSGIVSSTGGNDSTAAFEINNGGFRMTGGTLSATGSTIGIRADVPQQISLEGGSVTVQGKYAAFWCKYGGDALSFGGRTVIGGETAEDTQILSVQTINDCTSVAAGELVVGSGDNMDDDVKGSNAAKYVCVTGSGQAGQLIPSDNPNFPTVEPIPAAGTAVARTQSVLLDGKTVQFQCYAVKDAKGNETNYVKIRDLANALNGTKAQFNVGWDGKVSITSNTAYKAAGGEGTTPYSGNQPYTSVSSTPVSFNGTSVNLTSFLIKDSAGNGYTYYKLRDLGQLLGFNVKWNGSAKSVVIETGRPFTGQ